MIYIIAILVFIATYSFGWFCGFSTGSLHGYNKALNDAEKELIELTKRAEGTIRKDENNE